MHAYEKPPALPRVHYYNLVVVTVHPSFLFQDITSWCNGRTVQLVFPLIR
ncbi:hypothetical protein CLOSTMETH_03005 [[Clostridium] methylpentosum DSM 5476]|uniref:Uncharacterized protein n=1 Tax=[Clostridium] methylpentosum DSM 5476 TaxID=537013 RepID=C0EGL2_9FIRM|nr:hypothetical protein CLOSTMETH_03005 [[Clostridium] methylpentosum DSM 5476]